MRRLGLVALGLVLVLLVAAALTIRSRLTADGIKATLEAQASAALGEPVHIGTVAVRWLPRPGLTLEKVAVGASRTLVIERLVVSTGLRPLLSRQIAEADILVEQSRLDAPRFLALLTAPAAPELAAVVNAPAHDRRHPLDCAARRILDVRAANRGRERRSAYAGNRLDIQRLDARSDITQLVASGAVTDLSRRRCQLTVKARSLNLDELIEFLAPFSSPSSPRPARPGDPVRHHRAPWPRARDARSAPRSPISRRPVTSPTGRQR